MSVHWGSCHSCLQVPCMKSGTSTAGTKTVFVSRTRMILIFPRFSGSWIFSGFGVSHFALGIWLLDCLSCMSLRVLSWRQGLGARPFLRRRERIAFRLGKACNCADIVHRYSLAWKGLDQISNVGVSQKCCCSRWPRWNAWLVMLWCKGDDGKVVDTRQCNRRGKGHSPSMTARVPSLWGPKCQILESLAFGIQTT